MKNKLNRLSFHTLKLFVNIFSYFNHRQYMKLYIPLLKSMGMKINGTPRYIGSHVSFDD